MKIESLNISFSNLTISATFTNEADVHRVADILLNHTMFEKSSMDDEVRRLVSRGVRWPDGRTFHHPARFIHEPEN